MEEYRYTKSFIGEIEKDNSYSLTIKQHCEKYEDYTVWGEDKTRSISFDNETIYFFRTKKELYDAILNNLIKYENIKFKFLNEKLFLNNENDNFLEIYLKTGYVDVDIDHKYIREENKEKYTYVNGTDLSYYNDRRNAYAQMRKKTKKIKEKETVQSINLKVNSIRDYLNTSENALMGFDEYIISLIKQYKGLEKVNINLPLSESYDTRKLNIDNKTYNLIKELLKDFKENKPILEYPKYNHIFYILNNMEYNSFTKLRELKPFIDNSNVVIFKYIELQNEENKSITFKDVDYNSIQDFKHTVKNKMYEIKDEYLKNKCKKITAYTTKMNNEKVLIVCFYEIQESKIRDIKEYLYIKQPQNKNIDVYENTYQNNYNFEKNDLEFTLKKDKNNIFYFTEYHPYWIYEDGEKDFNPEFGENDSRILDLKKEVEEFIIREAYPPNKRFKYVKRPTGKKSNGASNYFFNKIIHNLENYFSTLLKSSEKISVTVVPSHKIEENSVGMEKIAKQICDYFNFEYEDGLLRRYKDIEKLSTGGNRDIFTHYNSIKVSGEPKYETILLLDDVTTTGNSLIACRNLLEREGYDVICMAIAKTVKG